jgi:hypothetical protein
MFARTWVEEIWWVWVSRERTTTAGTLFDFS